MGVVACPLCQAPLNVPAEWMGKKVRCRACTNVFVAGAPASRPAAGESRPPAPARTPPPPPTAAPARPIERPSASGRAGKQWEVGETVALSGRPTAGKPKVADYDDEPQEAPPVAKLICYLPFLGAMGLMIVGGALGGGLGGGIAGLFVTLNLAIFRQSQLSFGARVAAVLALGVVSNVALIGGTVMLVKRTSRPKAAPSATVANVRPPKPVTKPSPKASEGPAEFPGPPAMPPGAPGADAGAGNVRDRSIPITPPPWNRNVQGGPYRQADGAKYKTLLGPFQETDDPGGDCTISVDGASASIEVPGTVHDLVRRPRSRATAPRAFTKVQGDFFVKVTIPPYDLPQQPPAPGSETPYHGAGIFLMGDDGESLRLERASFERAGVVRTYVLGSRQAGEWEPTEESVDIPPNGPLHLFVERRNGRLVSGISTDNMMWTISEVIPFTADKVDVGIAAVNTTTRPFKAVFRDIQLRVP